MANNVPIRYNSRNRINYRRGRGRRKMKRKRRIGRV
jgi:hypothetical protein